MKQYLILVLLVVSATQSQAADSSDILIQLQNLSGKIGASVTINQMSLDTGVEIRKCGVKISDNEIYVFAPAAQNLDAVAIDREQFTMKLNTASGQQSNMTIRSQENPTLVQAFCDGKGSASQTLSVQKTGDGAVSLTMMNEVKCDNKSQPYLMSRTCDFRFAPVRQAQ